MESLWETIKRGLREGTSTALGKAEELTVLGRARLDIAAVKNQIHRQQTDLGAEVYRLLRTEQAEDLAQNPAVQDQCARIGDLEQELQAKERALAELQAELKSSRPPQEQPDSPVEPDTAISEEQK